jgi:ankyrin repeat protein
MHHINNIYNVSHLHHTWQVAAMLLEGAANMDLQGESGGTALTRASDRGHLDIVRMLLERGANPDVQNTLGYTALMWASARGHLEVVRMLLDKVSYVLCVCVYIYCSYIVYWKFIRSVCCARARVCV